MGNDKKIELEKWYQLYSDAIFKYICMMTRDYQQAEDLTQETFIRAYNNMETFERKSETKTWLFRIAHNMTIDYLRKNKPLRILESFLLNKKDTAPLPEDVLHMKENIREIYRALGNLKHSYREVIILRKIKDFSIQETSDILGWSENKVKVTLHRAMPLLQKELGREEAVYEETT
ncbi:RNA polymerase sigma factor [Evansella sp. AB-rgal1]|uniref:RNA polymerase sigma factor n=1 Tax=Evansella sp. AB-rgal1 TaxID=3242696 RepID=UPI00359D52D3